MVCGNEIRRRHAAADRHPGKNSRRALPPTCSINSRPSTHNCVALHSLYHMYAHAVSTVRCTTAIYLCNFDTPSHNGSSNVCQRHIHTRDDQGGGNGTITIDLASSHTGCAKMLRELDLSDDNEGGGKGVDSRRRAGGDGGGVDGRAGAKGGGGADADDDEDGLDDLLDLMDSAESK